MRKVDINEKWDLMLENNIASEETMHVVTDILGYNDQALDDIFSVTTEYHTFDDWYEDMYGLEHLCMDDEILETLELTDEDWVELHNEMCKADKYMDNYIHSMDDFDEAYENLTPLQIAMDVRLGDFNPNMPLWYYDGCGNPHSCYYSDAPVYKEDIVRYMIRTGDALGLDEVQHILDEMENDL